jgi:hypothetical protein
MKTLEQDPREKKSPIRGSEGDFERENPSTNAVSLVASPEKMKIELTQQSVSIFH